MIADSRAGSAFRAPGGNPSGRGSVAWHQTAWGETLPFSRGRVPSAERGTRNAERGTLLYSARARMTAGRVVVTGMGALTPVGLDVPSTWDAVLHGRSGIALVEGFETADLDVKIAGQVKNFDPTTYLDKKEARRMDRFLQLGLVAAQEAMRDAELTIGPENADRVAVLV